MKAIELIIGVLLALGVVLALLVHLGYGIKRDAQQRRRLGRRDQARALRAKASRDRSGRRNR